MECRKNLKILIFILILTNILTIENDHRFRNLDVQYNKKYPIDNSQTGTGSSLRDVVYNILCDNLNCDSGCCEGPINQIVCGIPSNCKIYSNLLAKILGPLISILGVIYIIILCVECDNNDSKSDNCLRIILYHSCILFFPITLPIFLIMKFIRSKQSEYFNYLFKR